MSQLIRYVYFISSYHSFCFCVGKLFNTLSYHFVLILSSIFQIVSLFCFFSICNSLFCTLCKNVYFCCFIFHLRFIFVLSMFFFHLFGEHLATQLAITNKIFGGNFFGKDQKLKKNLLLKISSISSSVPKICL